MSTSLVPESRPRRTSWDRLLEREQAESELVGALTALDDAGAAFTVVGAAGTGKSLLLEVLTDDAAARGHLVLRCTGIPCEVSESGAGLHELLHPVLDHAHLLSPRHRGVLLSAFGLLDGPRPDRLALSLATLELLGLVARTRPVVVAVDDVQWVDLTTQEVLSFIGRRLRNVSILVVACVRDGAPATDRSLPLPVRTLRLGPLSPEAATSLVDRVAGSLSVADRHRVLAAAEGNPLALVELARSLRDANGEPAPDALHATRRLANSLLAGVAELPPDTRRFLVLIAASDRDFLPDLMPAAQRLGLQARDLAPAEQARVVHVAGDRVRFEQPLLRFALYGAAAWAERSEAHAALAATSRDDGRALWHRAALVQRGDAIAATQLEGASRRYALTGALDEAIRLLRRAAALSPSETTQAGRLAFAAELSWQAGRPTAARELIGEASGLSTEPQPAGQLSLTESVLALTAGTGTKSATEIVERTLHEAAGVMETSGRASSIAPALVASASLVWNHHIEGHTQRRVQRLIDAALDEPPTEGGGTWDAWTTGHLLAMARAWTDPVTGAGVRHVLPDVVAVLRQRVLERGQGHRRNTAHLVHASARTAEMVHDLPLARTLWGMAEEAVSTTHGASGAQARLVVDHALTKILTGQLSDAAVEAEQGGHVVEEMGLALLGRMAWASQVLVRAWTSESPAVDPRPPATSAGPTSALVDAVLAWGTGLAMLRDGRPEEAWPVISTVEQHPTVARWAAADVVETAIQVGDPAITVTVRSLVDEVSQAADVFDSAHLRSLALRSRALLGLGDPDDQFRRSAAEAQQAGAVLDRGRALLAHGAWRRRHGQVVAARDVLAEAHFVFAGAGAAPWAVKAAEELRAAGAASPGSASRVDLSVLNEQEREIARLAASGLTNKQIASRLYCSPRTVGSHLYRMFPKLGITSRAQLAEALRQE